ncbi:hypothetical protein B0J14DRAFT_329303 [Halenospora varia]|nr:hypothetical protein B0J14DRAFT_329303 [Halenospora varia]
MWPFPSIPEPPLTEKNLPDQAGKVFIVTGATSGVGKELTQILFSHNAKVYLAARSSEKALATIEAIKKAHPNSKGEAVFLKLDLDDLTTIKGSAQEFLSKEQKLDVLWNNAGVMVPPQGSTTKQDYELQLGTNNVAPFLFTKLLTPILSKTATTAPAGSVRVVWVSSSAAERFSPEGGVEMGNLDYKNDRSAWHKYGVSKAGNILHCKEFARRHTREGIVSVALDPGNLKTDLYKGVPRWQMHVLNLILKEPIYGAYTELYGGLSLDITVDNCQAGTWVQPWGQIKTPRVDIEKSTKSIAEGGTGVGEKFWEWCEEQTSRYL